MPPQGPVSPSARRGSRSRRASVAEILESPVSERPREILHNSVSQHEKNIAAEVRKRKKMEAEHAEELAKMHEKLYKMQGLLSAHLSIPSSSNRLLRQPVSPTTKRFDQSQLDLVQAPPLLSELSRVATPRSELSTRGRQRQQRAEVIRRRPQPQMKRIQPGGSLDQVPLELAVSTAR